MNPVSFFTPLSWLCFYFWGVEVEKFLGRRHFIQICAALVAIPVLFISALYLFGYPGWTSGDYFLIVGLLVAFATLYPDMDYLGGWIPLKWFAFACIAFGSLMYFPQHDWAGLLQLWGGSPGVLPLPGGPPSRRTPARSPRWLPATSTAKTSAPGQTRCQADASRRTMARWT